MVGSLLATLCRKLNSCVTQHTILYTTTYNHILYYNTNSTYYNILSILSLCRGWHAVGRLVRDGRGHALQLEPDGADLLAGHRLSLCGTCVGPWTVGASVVRDVCVFLTQSGPPYSGPGADAPHSKLLYPSQHPTRPWQRRQPRAQSPGHRSREASEWRHSGVCVCVDPPPTQTPTTPHPESPRYPCRHVARPAVY